MKQRHRILRVSSPQFPRMLQATIEAVAARRSVTRTTHQQVVEGALEAVRLRREHEASVDLLPPREEEFRSDVAIRNSVDNLITSLHHMDHGDEPLPPPDKAYTADFSIRPIVEDSEEEAEGSPNAAEAFLNDDQRVRLQQQRWHSTGSSAEAAVEGRAAPPAAAAAAEGSGEASGEAGGGGDDDGWLQGKIEERLLLQRRSVARRRFAVAGGAARRRRPPPRFHRHHRGRRRRGRRRRRRRLTRHLVPRRDQANHGLDGEMRGRARAPLGDLTPAAAAAETAAVAAAASRPGGSRPPPPPRVPVKWRAGLRRRRLRPTASHPPPRSTLPGRGRRRCSTMERRGAASGDRRVRDTPSGGGEVSRHG